MPADDPVAALQHATERSAVPIIEIARAIDAAGGRALVVGGWVRDQLFGADPKDVESKDVDFEIYGLDPSQLGRALDDFGGILRAGRSYDVWRIRRVEVDLTVVPEALGSESDYTVHASRRDLTVNAMGWDPLAAHLFDPFDARSDLAARRLVEADSETFGSDPLRGIRVAQFIARFEMEPTESLSELCRALDLSALPRERIYEEMRKLLIKGRAPARGLAFLHKTDLLRFFPPLAALIDVPQDARWHPEGCVWTHTLLSLDVAARLRDGDERRDALLMWGVLCHDLGKPGTTEVTPDRVTSRGHDRSGEAIANEFLAGMRAPGALCDGVAALVRHHLAPMTFEREEAPAGTAAYRRLARRLAAAGVDLALLESVARADFLGRTTEAAARDEFSAGDRFRARAQALELEHQGPADVVLGRHLIECGYAPGPDFARLLQRCREIQDETGWSEPEPILERVRAEQGD